MLRRVGTCGVVLDERGVLSFGLAMLCGVIRKRYTPMREMK